MGDFTREADGRREFTAEFKRSTAECIRGGETTLATIAPEILKDRRRPWGNA